MSLSILTLTMITRQQSLEGSSASFRPRGTDICFYEGEVEKILHARMILAGKEKLVSRDTLAALDVTPRTVQN